MQDIIDEAVEIVRKAGGEPVAMAIAVVNDSGIVSTHTVNNGEWIDLFALSGALGAIQQGIGEHAGHRTPVPMREGH